MCCFSWNNKKNVQFEVYGLLSFTNKGIWEALFLCAVQRKICKQRNYFSKHSQIHQGCGTSKQRPLLVIVASTFGPDTKQIPQMYVTSLSKLPPSTINKRKTRLSSPLCTLFSLFALWLMFLYVHIKVNTWNINYFGKLILPRHHTGDPPYLWSIWLDFLT